MVSHRVDDVDVMAVISQPSRVHPGPASYVQDAQTGDFEVTSDKLLGPQ